MTFLEFLKYVLPSFFVLCAVCVAIGVFKQKSSGNEKLLEKIHKKIEEFGRDKIKHDGDSKVYSNRLKIVEKKLEKIENNFNAHVNEVTQKLTDIQNILTREQRKNEVYQYTIIAAWLPVFNYLRHSTEITPEMLDTLKNAEERVKNQLNSLNGVAK